MGKYMKRRISGFTAWKVFVIMAYMRTFPLRQNEKPVCHRNNLYRRFDCRRVLFNQDETDYFFEEKIDFLLS